MLHLYKKIELVANVAIIIVALLIGGVFLKKFLLDNGSQPRVDLVKARLNS